MSIGSTPSGTGAPPTGGILERQNAAWSITLLAAQRQLYSEVKRWRRARAWSVTLMAVLGVIATLFAPALLKILGPIGAALAVGQWGASLVEKQRGKMAANIQEQFDTTVLQLPWNPALGRKLDAEDVAAAAARFKGSRDKLADWYSLPDGVPHPLDSLLCQRTNLRWDATLRRAYANTMLAVLILLVLVILLAGVARNLSLGEFLLALLPSSGAFLLGTETVRAHRQHSADQLDVKRQVESLWEKSRGNPRDVNSRDLRPIQDRIYGLRVAAPSVPDEFYWRKREQFELEMRTATERLWHEALAARKPGRGNRTGA